MQLHHQLQSPAERHFLLLRGATEEKENSWIVANNTFTIRIIEESVPSNSPPFWFIISVGVVLLSVVGGGVLLSGVGGPP